MPGFFCGGGPSFYFPLLGHSPMTTLYSVDFPNYPPPHTHTHTPYNLLSQGNFGFSNTQAQYLKLPRAGSLTCCHGDYNVWCQKGGASVTALHVPQPVFVWQFVGSQLHGFWEGAASVDSSKAWGVQETVTSTRRRYQRMVAAIWNCSSCGPKKNVSGSGSPCLKPRHSGGRRIWSSKAALT